MLYNSRNPSINNMYSQQTHTDIQWNIWDMNALIINNNFERRTTRFGISFISNKYIN